MKRLLTAGIFGTILGIVGTGTANASIVSSGFLDEKLTEYALSTSLDLKANQSDFIELNTQISDSVDNLKMLWGAEIGDLAYGFNPNKVNNNINGAFDLVEGFILHSMLSLTGGWTDSVSGQTYLGIKDLNTKIGTLPEGITVQGMYQGWTDENGALANPGLKAMYEGWTDKGGDGFPGVYAFSKNERLLLNAYESQTAPLLIQGARATTIDGVDYTGPIYPLWKLSEGIDKIGTLPSSMLTYKYTANGTLDYAKYPAADLLGKDYNIGGLLNIILHGSENLAGVKILSLPEISTRTLYLDSKIASIETKIGTVPDGKNLAGMISETDAKIGTLPSGVAPMLSSILEDFNSRHTIFPVDATYPQSLEELIIDLYGDTSAKHPGILAILFGDTIDLLWGLEDEIYGNDNHTGLFDRTGAIERQIGTLPAGYDSVGAALTAIKGIAEDAKAAALAAIPDPKQEGSSGKFVLTVDIVGDNATYHWEKIDREGETTTTTTE